VFFFGEKKNRGRRRNEKGKVLPKKKVQTRKEEEGKSPLHCDVGKKAVSLLSAQDSRKKKKKKGTAIGLPLLGKKEVGGQKGTATSPLLLGKGKKRSGWSQHIGKKKEGEGDDMLKTLNRAEKKSTKGV